MSEAERLAEDLRRQFMNDDHNFDTMIEASIELRRLSAELAALKAAIEAQGVPDGWQLVPKEPTIGMLVAGGQYRVSTERPNAQHAIYAAMLASAPPAQQAKPAQRVIANIKHDKLGHPYAVMKTAYDDEGNGLEEGAALVLASDQQARKE